MKGAILIVLACLAIAAEAGWISTINSVGIADSNLRIDRSNQEIAESTREILEQTHANNRRLDTLADLLRQQNKLLEALLEQARQTRCVQK